MPSNVALALLLDGMFGIADGACGLALMTFLLQCIVVWNLLSLIK